MPGHELCVEPQADAIGRLIAWVQVCCRTDGVADDDAFAMMLALEEAVANVIAHGFAAVPPPHRITVRLDISAQSCIAEVIDNGRPFDPTAAPGPDPSLPLEQREPGGLGILLMRRMVDRLEYRRGDGGNVLRLEKARR